MDKCILYKLIIAYKSIYLYWATNQENWMLHKIFVKPRIFSIFTHCKATVVNLKCVSKFIWELTNCYNQPSFYSQSMLWEWFKWWMLNMCLHLGKYATVKMHQY